VCHVGFEEASRDIFNALSCMFTAFTNVSSKSLRGVTSTKNNHSVSREEIFTAYNDCSMLKMLQCPKNNLSQ